MTVINAPGEQRRDALIDATIQVIAEYGIDGTSLSRIASAADMSKPAVLYYLNSRDKLIDAAVERILQTMSERVGPPEGDDPRAALFGYVERTLRAGWQNPVLLRAGYAVRHALPAEHARYRTATLRALLAQGAEAGALDVSDPDITALGIDGSLDAILLAGLADGADHETLVDEAIGTLDRVVTAR